MKMKTALREIESRWAEIKDLEAGLSILGWDQEVMMPPGGAEARAATLATLTQVVHERLTDRGLLRSIERVHKQREVLPRRQRRMVALARRRARRAALLPGSLAAEIARTESRAIVAWRRARQASDFSQFAPLREHMLGLKRQVARLVNRKGEPYDALLDEYEPGATLESIDPLLRELQEFTVPLVRHVANARRKPDQRPLLGLFDVDGQRAFAQDVVSAMGIDQARSRMDLSTHPFCGGVGPGDVRMTGRFHPKDMRGGFFGSIHEAGHGLYEQGLDPKRARSPLGGAVSMAIHESQSRLWENMVARGRPFWKHWLPRLVKVCPRLKGTRLEDFWRAANVMKPSLTRVEADELTYNLHIVLRYEIERDLVAGHLKVRDLPERFADGMQHLLGIRPRNDAEGVLQDIHWSMGAFGYFPTYSLGNLYAAQFMEAGREDLPDLDAEIARGQMESLATWLRERIHRHDQLYDAETLCKRVTGAKLTLDPFRRYIEAKVEALYGPLPA
jgi:carboxypeptidase Taq